MAAKKRDLTHQMSLWIGRTRYMVLIPILAVLIGAFSLFLQGTIQAFEVMHETWSQLIAPSSEHKEFAVDYLAIVSTLLKAVVFYLIGVGLYSLFIQPLNLTSALGVDSLADLEHKIISVVIVILAVVFLEHYVHFDNGTQIVQYGIALALAVASLVWFQRVSHEHSGTDELQPESRLRARHELFDKNHEKMEIDEEKLVALEEKQLERVSSDSETDSSKSG